MELVSFFLEKAENLWDEIIFKRLSLLRLFCYNKTGCKPAKWFNRIVFYWTVLCFSYPVCVATFLIKRLAKLFFFGMIKYHLIEFV